MSNFNRRLPLPGEKPTTVWKPGERKTRHPWYRAHSGLLTFLWRLMPWAAAILALGAGLSTWRATSTHVTLVVNGQPVEVATHRRTVEGAARTAGIRPDDTLYIDPPAGTPLEAGMVITLAHQRPVIVHVDGETRIAPTHLTDPLGIVAELGIALGPSDAARVERAAKPSGPEIAANPALAGLPPLPREISVVRARRVIVNEVVPGGEQTRVSFETTAPTLGQALAAAGYALYEADRVAPPPGTAIAGEEIEVTIERATPVTVHADGQIIAHRTHRTTVGALLDELGLAPGGGDYVLPPADASLRAGDVVRVVRVREETLVQAVPIPFETTYVPDPDLVLDQQRELQAGQEGILERRVRVRTEDGVEVSRVTEGEWVARHPQARVVAYGTKIVIRVLETPYGELHYWRKLRVLATSYSPLTAGHKQPGDPFFGLSGTGTPVQRGIIATDPRVIALYTHMYVPGYGVGQALDVGGAVKGLRIDLGYDDEHYVMWNNWVEIYLLVPVPPYDRIAWVLPE